VLCVKRTHVALDKPMEPSTQRAREHHAGIHGLRGACVLAIFAYHVVNSGLLPPASSPSVALWLWLCDGLRYGVEVFFMISGYVIVRSLQRHANVALFARDRVLRIFPLWLPLAVAMLAAALAASHMSGIPSRALPSAWTLVPSLLILAPVLPVTNIHPAQWSLCYELFFYVFAAAAWQVRHRALALRLLCLAPALCFVVLFPRALFFVPGVLVALYEPRLRERVALMRWAWIGLPLAWVAWLSTGTENAALSRTLIDFVAQGQGLLAVAAFLGGSSFFAWIVLFRAHPERHVLGTQGMQWLGTISFSFYLVHPIVMGGVKRVLLPVLHLSTWPAILVFVVVSLAGSCVASYLTWKYLEVGLRRWLLSHSRTATPLAVHR
jgi:peptidoglycan/LPS O-acetylase OafA/YrhL